MSGAGDNVAGVSSKSKERVFICFDTDADPDKSEEIKDITDLDMEETDHEDSDFPLGSGPGPSSIRLTKCQ